MKIQYYAKANIAGFGSVLMPYSGTFNNLEEAEKWYSTYGVKLENKLLTKRKLILAEAIETNELCANII